MHTIFYKSYRLQECRTIDQNSYTVFYFNIFNDHSQLIYTTHTSYSSVNAENGAKQFIDGLEIQEAIIDRKNAYNTWRTAKDRLHEAQHQATMAYDAYIVTLKRHLSVDKNARV